MFNDYPHTDLHELNLDWVIKKVKELSAAWVETSAAWQTQQEAFDSLRAFVNDYFDNLDVQEEINNKIDDLVTDGTLSELIAPYVASGLPAVVATQLAGVVAQQITSVVAAQLPDQVAAQLPAIAAQAAADEVSAWLVAHINPDTGYVIDDTLTVQGAAADAKAAGDAIGELKSALDVVVEEYKPLNIWNPEGYGYYNRNGTYYSSTNQKRMRVNVSEGDVFRIYRWGTYDYVEQYRSSPTMRLCAFDSSDNAISTIDVTNASSYTVPNGVASLDLSINIAINADPLVTLNSEIVPSQKTEYFEPYLAAKTDDTLSVKNGIADAKATGEAIDGLDNRLSDVESIVSDKYEIVMPNKVFMTPNQQLNIYNDNIINGTIGTDKYVDYSVNSYAPLSKLLNGHIQINPIEAGQQYGFVYVKDKLTGDTLKSKQFTLYCVNHMASEKKIIYIGDSLTDIGYYPAMMKINSSDKLVSIGTREREVTIYGNTYTVKNEGRGGWSAIDYVTKASVDAVTNAFWNPSTQDFDFSYYMSNNSFDGVDIVCLNLGTNGTARADDTCDAIDEMIASIHDYNSNILILVSLITPGASQDGWGNLVHTASADEFKRRQMTLIKKYLTKYQDVVSNVHVNPWYLNLDSLHDFGTAQYALSSRNPEIVTMQNNNVHPSVYGYWKMADVLYSTICYYLAN